MASAASMERHANLLNSIRIQYCQRGKSGRPPTTKDHEVTTRLRSGRCCRNHTMPPPVNTLIERTLGFSAIHWLAVGVSAKCHLYAIVAR